MKLQSLGKQAVRDGYGSRSQPTWTPSGPSQATRHRAPPPCLHHAWSVMASVASPGSHRRVRPLLPRAAALSLTESRETHSPALSQQGDSTVRAGGVQSHVIPLTPLPAAATWWILTRTFLRHSVGAAAPVTLSFPPCPLLHSRPPSTQSSVWPSALKCAGQTPRWSPQRGAMVCLVFIHLS